MREFCNEKLSFEAQGEAAHCGPKCRAAKKKAAQCGPKCRAARRKTEASAAHCGPKCRAAKRKGPQKIKVTSKKKGKGGKSYNCPQGRGHVARYCPKLEAQIKKVLGGDVKCWSNLFGVEGGCSHTVYHDPVKAHNPHAGIGLCAIESSPAVRKQNRRGPACANIKGLANQMICCRSLMKNTNGRYFGTVGCGNVGKCS